MAVNPVRTVQKQWKQNLAYKILSIIEKYFQRQGKWVGQISVGSIGEQSAIIICRVKSQYLKYHHKSSESVTKMADFNDFNIQLDYNNVGDAQRAQKSPIPNPPKNISSDAIPSYNNSSKNQQKFNVGSSDYNLSNAAHPVACVATIGFKAIAIFFYLFVGMFAPDVITFIIVMIMSSLDFWTVKNVTGRLLVGLRWWSDYDEKGDEVWRFQSFDKEFKSNTVDKTFFWSAQLGSSIFWAIFLLIKVLSLSPFWALLNLINFGLSSINLYGYYKCRGDHNKKIKALQSEGIRRFAGKIFM